MLSNGKMEFTVTPQARSQLFTPDSTPLPIKLVYKKCTPPPNLHSMDQFMDNGKSCMEQYTNPNFFIDEWIMEQKKLREQAREDRRKRREERKKQLTNYYSRERRRGRRRRKGRKRRKRRKKKQTSYQISPFYCALGCIELEE